MSDHATLKPDDEVSARLERILGSGSTQNRLHVHNAIDYAMRRIMSVCPEGRARALAFTKLEEAFMWALTSL